MKYKFVVCINNQDFQVSLEKMKIYRKIEDKSAFDNDLLRIIDESGEDYLYPKNNFVDLKIPHEISDLFSKELSVA